MAAAARNDSIIFKTLTEPLLYGQIKLQSDWPDLNAILIFVALGIASFTFLIVIYIFFKFRNMATAILVLQQFAKVKSQSVPSFIYEKITQAPTATEPSVIEKFITSEFSWLHASVVLSSIVLIFLTVLVCCLYRSRKSKCTTIYLEITSGGDCITVPIQSLSLCPSYYDFTTPTIRDISISAFPQCKLFAVFYSFSITNKLTTKTINIPTAIGIDFITHYKLKKILKQPFNAYVLVTHQGFASVLNPPNIIQNEQQAPDQLTPTSLYPKI